MPASFLMQKNKKKERKNERKKWTGEKSRKQKPGKTNQKHAIADMIKALEPEIARALPSVITPERFTRMALNIQIESLKFSL